MSNSLAVIFDMDGVLVDTYRAHFKSWQAMAAESGLTITEAQFARTFGCTSREIIACLWGDGRYSDADIACLDEKKEAAFREIVAADFPHMPGAPELIESLHEAGFALALGSSGPPENIDLVLDQLGKRSLFGAIVSGADVRRGKPDPQVFLIAAARLRIPPERCAVVEDAQAGIAAAKAAGAASIGLVSTGRTRPSLAAADLVVDWLQELSPEIVRELILRRLE